MQQVFKKFSILLPVSIFIGFMIMTAGIAIYPPFAQITAPFLCSTGKYAVSSAVQNVSAIESVQTVNIQCSDAPTNSQDDPSSLTIGLYCFFIYTVISLIILMACSYLWPFIFKNKKTP